MSRTFEHLQLQEFTELLRRFKFTRTIDMVHMHHTWRPNHAQYSGQPTIFAMWQHHTERNGWSDIAQHISIAPDGTIWLGRNWNAPPASAKGYNGNYKAGPFMFEMIGDFDAGRDPFKDPQRATAIEVIARVQARFGLPPEALRFHNQMSGKSCPGQTIDYGEIVEAVRLVHGRLPQESAGRGAEASPFDAHADRVWEVLRRFEATPVVAESVDTESADEELIGGRGGDFGGDEVDDAALARLRPYFVNLRQGEFSDDGRATTSKGDVDAIFDQYLPRALAAARKRDQPLRILFYAHGGLVSESRALAIAQAQADWWLANNVYPLFFIWETGLMETIGQLLSRSRQLVAHRAARDIADYTTDPIIEAMARALFGPRIWSGMKRSAERASDANGGARYVAHRLAKFCQENKEIELHAVGHSAGAIFHAHFLPACLREGVASFKTVSLLAPAMRVDLFRSNLEALLGGGIDHLGMFTMRKDLELADHCAQVYRKSLLYLIHYALEPEPRTPILGLEASIRADRDLARLFGLTGQAAPHADIVWSQTEAATGADASQSTTHGGFDNDAPTMNSVLRRVLDRSTGAIVEFPAAARERGISGWEEQIDWPAEAEALSRPGAVAMPWVGAAAATPVGAASFQAAPPTGATGGRRRALCVGIDTYPTAPLYGCVADANLWAATLARLGFERPTMLLNGAATRDAILQNLEALVQSSRPGDALVFQYAGHGTQLPDLDGDEARGDSPGLDEALCAFDFASGAYVLDDDVGAVFNDIPAGVTLSCLIDCCHSGTISRFGVGVGPNGIKKTNQRARFLPATPANIQAHRNFRANKPNGRSATTRGKDAMREVLFSACLSTEVAYETAGQGDFTLRATRLLAAGIDGMTNDSFLQAVTQAFGAAARQHPGLYCDEGQRHAPLLGVADGGRGRAARQGGAPAGGAADRLREIANVLEALGV